MIQKIIRPYFIPSGFDAYKIDSSDARILDWIFHAYFFRARKKEINGAPFRQITQKICSEEIRISESTVRRSIAKFCTGSKALPQLFFAANTASALWLSINAPAFRGLVDEFEFKRAMYLHNRERDAMIDLFEASGVEAPAQKVIAAPKKKIEREKNIVNPRAFEIVKQCLYYETASEKHPTIFNHRVDADYPSNLIAGACAKIVAIYEGKFSRDIFRVSEKFEEIVDARDYNGSWEKVKRVAGDWERVENLVLNAVRRHAQKFDERNSPRGKKWLTTNLDLFFHDRNSLQGSSQFLCAVMREVPPASDWDVGKIFDSIPEKLHDEAHGFFKTHRYDYDPDHYTRQLGALLKIGEKICALGDDVARCFYLPKTGARLAEGMTIDFLRWCAREEERVGKPLPCAKLSPLGFVFEKYIGVIAQEKRLDEKTKAKMIRVIRDNRDEKSA